MKDSDYLSNFFEVGNVEEAKQKILTPENGFSTEERWQTETTPLANMLLNKLEISEGDTVVDYGCGIGRISKYLLEKNNADACLVSFFADDYEDWRFSLIKIDMFPFWN